MSADRGLFGSELDFLREGLREAFDDPTARPARHGGGVGWAEHPAEGLVELVPPSDLYARLRATLPPDYLDQRGVKDQMLLATTPEAGDRALRRAVQGTKAGDQSTQWPTAHYLSPLHPVLDWAVDRALTRLGRNQVPVATADVMAPTAVVLGTLANRSGQIVLRAVVGMQFLAPGLAPVIHQDVPELLDEAGFRSGAVNTGAPLDLDPHTGLVPAAVAQMRRYMAVLTTERAGQLSEPLATAARGIEAWAKESAALADGLAPAAGARMRRQIGAHAEQAGKLVDSLTARNEPMVRVLLVLLPKEPSA